MKKHMMALEHGNLELLALITHNFNLNPNIFIVELRQNKRLLIRMIMQVFIIYLSKYAIET